MFIISVIGVPSTGCSLLQLPVPSWPPSHSDTPVLIEYRSITFFFCVRLCKAEQCFSFIPPQNSDTHVRMLEDYIQETILDQNKLAAGSDRYDKMRCCSNDCVCMLGYQLFSYTCKCHLVMQCCWLLYAIGNKNNLEKLHFNNLKTGFLWKNVLHLLQR